MGCAAASLRSITDSRLCAKPTVSSWFIQNPSPSGPRCARASAIFFKRWVVIKAGLGDIIPAMPHIVGKYLKSLRQIRIFSADQLKYFPTIGILLPTPKAFELTRMTGQNWLRLYSFIFTSFNILFTSAASIPIPIISFGPCLFSIY